MKIRLIEPANTPYRRSPLNLFVYDRHIRTPSQGLLTLSTIAKRMVEDTLMYSESISKIVWDDVLDADIVFLGVFTFNAQRGYELAERIRRSGRALVVIGGLHATLNPEEAARHCDCVLLGEGDETVPALIKAVREGLPLDFPGVARYKGNRFFTTGRAPAPQDIDTVPDRDLLYRFRKMAGHNTIWPQVHASRCCPHNCDYCALVAAFGRSVRTRSPEAVVRDIREAIAFFETGHRRIARMLWITDDNFFADRAWAVGVLRLIIAENIQYNFTIQARYEVGFDDEMLDLLRQAGFSELAVGIEFLEDEAFEAYHKKSTYREILSAAENIRRHGLRVRGLFIVGADSHTRGVGRRLADFVIRHDICGVLIQSMYFIPGTPVYETHKGSLIDENWARCTGKVVHNPEHISACDLQKEIILASRSIYSLPRLMDALLHKRGIERTLFLGEYFWQMSVRRELKRDLAYLRAHALPGPPEKTPCNLPRSSV